MHYTAERYPRTHERRSDQPAGQPADLPVRQVVFEGTHYYIVRDVLAAAGRSTRGATDAVYSLPEGCSVRLPVRLVNGRRGDGFVWGVTREGARQLARPQTGPGVAQVSLAELLAPDGEDAAGRRGGEE